MKIHLFFVALHILPQFEACSLLYRFCKLSALTTWTHNFPFYFFRCICRVIFDSKLPTKIIRLVEVVVIYIRCVSIWWTIHFHLQHVRLLACHLMGGRGLRAPTPWSDCRVPSANLSLSAELRQMKASWVEPSHFATISVNNIGCCRTLPARWWSDRPDRNTICICYERLSTDINLAYIVRFTFLCARNSQYSNNN